MKYANRKITLEKREPSCWLGKNGRIDFCFPLHTKKKAKAAMDEIKAVLTKHDVYD
jgi:hypothetical protein